MALTGSMLDWGAYNKTDPDEVRRQQLLAQSRLPGRQGEAAMALLQREDAVRAHTQDLEENRNQSNRTRRDIAAENEAGRQERAGVRAELSRSSQADRRTQDLIAGITAAGYMGEKGQPIAEKLMNEYMKEKGIGQETPAGAKTTTPGEYGPGGAQPATAPAAAAATPAAAEPIYDATAATYGTNQLSQLKPDMIKAADIPTVYGGKSSIPAGGGAAAGYYDTAGKFLGPAYSPKGDLIPMPAGATGIQGRTESNAVVASAAPDAYRGDNLPQVAAAPIVTQTTPVSYNAPAPAPVVQPATGISPPTANFNIHTGFTPQGVAANQQMGKFLGSFLNLPGQQNQLQPSPSAVYIPPPVVRKKDENQ